MSESFKRIQREDRRFLILKFTNTGGGCNSTMLQAFLDDMQHRVSCDKIRDDLSSLEDVGLIDINKENSGVLFGGGEVVAWCITQRGSDVVAGRVQVPGVREPRIAERE